MGSWDVSCSLTGTPIYPGDPCVFVICRKDLDIKTELLDPHADYTIASFWKTTYDDYGRPAANYGGPKLQKLVDCWDRGKPNPDFRFHFWVCQRAWDWCQIPGNLPCFWRAPSEELKEMANVLLAFRMAHRNILAGYHATGQWDCPDDFDSVEANARLTLECIAAARAIRLEEEKEEA